MATRRQFLSGALAAASAAAAQSSPDVQTVPLPTHEWFGDKIEQFEFPAGWRIERHEMKGYAAPALTREQIREAVRTPVGTPRLQDIAAGKKTAAIAFDDVTRPTPAYAVLPHVIEELRSAGIKDENILFIAALGCRCQMNSVEAAKKLGLETVQRHPWINHNPWENLVDLGAGVSINAGFANAGVKIAISGLESDGESLSGGAPAMILSGLSGIQSIRSQGRRTPRSPRPDTEELDPAFTSAVRRAGVDFSVQIVCGHDRQPVKVVSGAIVRAHRETARFAANHFSTGYAADAGIVVVNAYPCGAELYERFNWARHGLKTGGSIVVVNQNPLGLCASSYSTGEWSGEAVSYFARRDSRKPRFPEARQVLLYSQYLQARELDHPGVPPETQGMRRWDDVIQALRQAHSEDGLKVVVYPYAGLQLGA